MAVLSKCPIISKKPISSSPLYSHPVRWLQIPLGMAGSIHFGCMTDPFLKRTQHSFRSRGPGPVNWLKSGNWLMGAGGKF